MNRGAAAGGASPSPSATPATARGRRARAQLLEAARRVFERDGFLEARVTDIATEAGVAHGSFYTYFGSKAEVFRALMTETMDELYQSLGEADDDGQPTDPVVRVDRANRRFIDMYRQNTALMALFEQVTTFDPEVRALRQAVRRRMAGRVTHSIEQLQDEGAVDPALDPHCSANALVAMVNGLVHYWLVMGEDFDQEVLSQTLTRLWAQSLGLRPGA
jgi:AcrR family transcriptional regulator